jgi:hypothetical protein
VLLPAVGVAVVARALHIRVGIEILIAGIAGHALYSHA